MGVWEAFQFYSASFENFPYLESMGLPALNFQSFQNPLDWDAHISPLKPFDLDEGEEDYPSSLLYKMMTFKELPPLSFQKFFVFSVGIHLEIRNKNYISLFGIFIGYRILIALIVSKFIKYLIIHNL